MSESTITSKGQTTVPADVRERLGGTAGTKLPETALRPTSQRALVTRLRVRRHKSICAADGHFSQRNDIKRPRSYPSMIQPTADPGKPVTHHLSRRTFMVSSAATATAPLGAALPAAANAQSPSAAAVAPGAATTAPVGNQSAVPLVLRVNGTEHRLKGLRGTRAAAARDGQ